MISRRGLFGALAALVGGAAVAKVAKPQACVTVWKPRSLGPTEAWAREHVFYGHLGKVTINTSYESAAEAIRHARIGDVIEASQDGKALVYTIKRS